MIWACDPKSYAGRRAIGVKEQEKRKRGRPRISRRWLNRVRDDINEKGLPVEEVYDGATWKCTSSTPHKSGTKMKGGRRM